MTVDFREYFWGEKYNGYDILYRNMKYGYGASKELAEFFRERALIEETHSKLLFKLAKQAGSGCTHGTFAPFWQILKASSEKLSSLHAQMLQRFQDLVKEVQKYCEEQHKRHKQVKEEEAGTSEVVQSIQQTALTLHKAKENYNARCLEYEKLRRENGSVKDIEKAEVKCRKACEEYKSYIEKYAGIRDEFEKKMAVSCEHFQTIEETHLKQMKEFLSTYAQVLEGSHALIGQVHIEFRQQCNEMDVNKLLEQFTKLRGTGAEKPGPIEFEEADISTSFNQSGGGACQQSTELSNGGGAGEGGDNKGPIKKEGQDGVVQQASASDNGQPLTRTTFRASKCGAGVDDQQNIENNRSPSESIDSSATWFLKSKRDKRRDKKKKKKSNNDSKEDNSIGSIGDDGDSNNQSKSENPEVDDEGFRIRPLSDEKEKYLNDKDSFYSDSDGESEEEEKEKKIHIQIKPLKNGAPMSASVDELRATIGTLSLSPVSQHSHRRPDALHIRFKNRRAFNSAMSTPEDGPLKSPNASSASTPTGAITIGVSSPVATDTTSNSSSNRYAGLSDIFAEISANNDSSLELTKINNSATNSNSSSRVGTPTASILSSGPLLPRPPTGRRSVEHMSRGRMSPLPGLMTRTESVGSLTSDFKTTSMSVGSSRGPSPLTIGMSDPIPLAVAFQEVVHAYFRGTDEAKCQVRLMGDMKVSFPAGIVQVLANNPSPATLSFRVTKTGRLENVLPNKQLISQDPNMSAGDQHVYEFNMPALTALLRKQFEQTPNASYFNIDILKYHIKHFPGAKSTPLHLVAYWKCEEETTDLKIDYKYNPGALATMAPITNISVVVPVDGGVTNVQSMPSLQWTSENQRATWWISELSHHSDSGGMGSLRAHFDLTSGPSTPSTLAAQFTCMGTSLSGADFELLGLGYRLSLVKKQVVAGKYLCEGDSTTSYV